MWQLNGWEALLPQFIFLYILTVQESYNTLDYFCMGIIEKISFFFFDVEDPVRNQNFCAENAKMKTQGVWNAKKKVKVGLSRLRKFFPN